METVSNKFERDITNDVYERHSGRQETHKWSKIQNKLKNNAPKNAAVCWVFRDDHEKRQKYEGFLSAAVQRQSWPAGDAKLTRC